MPRLVALFLLATLLASPALADFTTPGIGVNWTCDDLVTHSGGAVTGDGPEYRFHESVFIALGDVLTVEEGSRLVFEDTTGEVRLEINGSLYAVVSTFTSNAAQPGDWYGLVFKDTNASSVFDVQGCVVEYGRYGVDVVYADINLVDTTIRHCEEKAVDLTGSGGVVSGCVITDNLNQTIYMTLGSSPLIENCRLERNNLDNASPYPYINVGLQSVNSPTIRGCRIIGGATKSGGMAVWNSCEGLIEGNFIEGCGYGILCYSVGANPTIRGNTIFSNTINSDTVNWGFGIACNGVNQPVIEDNVIRHHWYGVAITGGAQPDLGGGGMSSGENKLIDNGLGGEVYAIFNNTSNPISATMNWYGYDVTTLEQVEDCIWHQADDLSLGPVDYDPSNLEGVVSGLENAPRPLELHGASPNPFNPRTRLAFTLGKDQDVIIQIHDARGRRVATIEAGHLTAGRQEVTWNGTGQQGEALPSGLYLYRVQAGAVDAVGRMQLVR